MNKNDFKFIDNPVKGILYDYTYPIEVVGYDNGPEGMIIEIKKPGYFSSLKKEYVLPQVIMGKYSRSAEGGN